MTQTQIVRRPLAGGLLVVPNSHYMFGPVDPANLLKIVHQFRIDEMATIYLVAVGAIVFDFDASGPLASKDVLGMLGGGVVPEAVTENEEEITKLQESRMRFVNFVSASIFGRAMAQKHSSLQGASYCGLDAVFGYGIDNNAVYFLQDKDRFKRAISDKIDGFPKGKTPVLAPEDISDAAGYTLRLWNRGKEFQYADLQACIVMNYQAMILHGQQYAAGSLALSFTVMESLIREIFYAYGLVSGYSKQQFATRNHSIAPLSRTQFKDKTFNNQINILYEGGLINNFLFQRLNDARIKRNNLMHDGDSVSNRESGNCLTTIRDLWAYLVESSFELMTGWTRLI